MVKNVKFLNYKNKKFTTAQLKLRASYYRIGQGLYTSVKIQSDKPLINTIFIGEKRH